MITKGEDSTNYGFFPSTKPPKSLTRVPSHADAMTVADLCGAKLRGWNLGCSTNMSLRRSRTGKVSSI
jgi:hypothetical protein